MPPSVSARKWTGYAVAGMSVAVLTLVLKLLGDHVNAATVSLVLLLNICCSRKE